MNRYLLLLVGSSATIIADQITKIWSVRALMRPNGQLPASGDIFLCPSRTDALTYACTDVYVVFDSWFNFKIALNKGAAWGLFRDLPSEWRVPFFALISAVAVTVILLFYRKMEGQKLVGSALVLIMGGAIGNLIDRVRLGWVVDFIDWHYGDSHWPTFNVADMAISLGVGLMILDMIINRHEEPKESIDVAPAQD
jgi:signal peptidase II